MRYRQHAAAGRLEEAVHAPPQLVVQLLVRSVRRACKEECVWDGEDYGTFSQLLWKFAFSPNMVCITDE